MGGGDGGGGEGGGPKRHTPGATSLIVRGRTPGRTTNTRIAAAALDATRSSWS